MVLVPPFLNSVIIQGTFKQCTSEKALRFNGKAGSVGRQTERAYSPQKDACSDRWLT